MLLRLPSCVLMTGSRKNIKWTVTSCDLLFIVWFTLIMPDTLESEGEAQPLSCWSERLRGWILLLCFHWSCSPAVTRFEILADRCKVRLLREQMWECRSTCVAPTVTSFPTSLICVAFTWISIQLRWPIRLRARLWLSGHLSVEGMIAVVTFNLMASNLPSA